MTPPTGWICSSCRSQLSLIRLRPVRLQVRRSFVSLQDVNNDKHIDEHNNSSKKEQNGSQQASNGEVSSSRGRGSLVSDVTPDVFLEKLFKSTGRELPSAPLRLRYSQRLSRIGREAPAQDTEFIEESRAGNSNRLEQRQGGERRAKLSAYWKGRTINSQHNGDISSSKAVKQGAVEKNILDAGDANQTRSSVILDSQEQHPALGEDNVRQESLLDPSSIPEPESLNPSNDRKFSRPGKGRERKPVVKRVKSTAYHSDYLRTEKLWQSYNAESQKGDLKDGKRISDTLTELLEAYSDNDDQRHATEVWRLIQAQEMVPTLKQWTIMLDLAGKRRDSSSLSLIWRSISAAGLLPDNVAWTTYISAIGRLQPSRLGRVLTSLELQWHHVKQNPSVLSDGSSDAERGNYSPSIVPYNAAIGTVVLKQNAGYLHEILARMEKIAVVPNIDTFNTLLKRAVTTEERGEVHQILQQMKRHDLEPDKVTITTLLDQRLREIGDDDDPEIIASNVKELFNELDAQGVKPAPHTYTTALSVLLRREKPNTIAAGAVMQHMREQGIESIHAYTVMISHYFASDPPNQMAVDGLFARAKAREIPVDWTFFDRVIEGYAWLGESDRMLDCIRYLPKIGRTPGWFALWRALQLLSEVQYYEVCEEIVNDVERKGGIGTYGPKTQAKGEPYFWDLVAQLRAAGLISSRRADARYTQSPETVKIEDFRTGDDILDDDRPLNTSMSLGYSVPGEKANTSQDNETSTNDN